METPIPNSQLAQLVADLEEDAVLKLVDERIKAGDDSLKIIAECNEGMREVGCAMKKGNILWPG